MLNIVIMIDSDLPGTGPQTSQATPKIKGVADDMAAIFGRELRSDAAALPILVRPEQLHRKRRPWLAALAAGGVVTMLAAGIVGGSNVMEAPVAAAAKSVATKRPHPLPQPAAVPVVAPQPVQVADATPSLPPSPVTVEEDAPVTPEAAAPRPYVTNRDIVADAPPRPVAPRVERPSYAPERAAALATAPARSTCFDEASCLAPQLRSAERTVAVAYDQATMAQVRAGTLRDYRDEWLRARRVAVKRPREALRIYGMIAADLHVFAEDAPAGDRVALR
jgi:hypothetical protein